MGERLIEGYKSCVNLKDVAAIFLKFYSPLRFNLA
jgi:hypothetical protein